MNSWIRPIERMGACIEALAWAENYETIDEAWVECKRGDWMLWLLGNLAGNPDSDSRKKLAFTTCQCARLSLPYVLKGEKRPLKAIETVEAWAKGERNITLPDVRAAADAAYAAAADAAYAAAYAASDADAAAYAAAYAASDADARKKTLKKCADIVREYYDVPVIKKEGTNAK